MSEARRDSSSTSDDSHVATNAWRMLEAAHRAGGDPLSDLAATLASIDARALLRETFDEPNGPLHGFGDSRTLLERGAGIEVFRAMKSCAKRALSPEVVDGSQQFGSQRRCGLLAFELVVSATLVHHQVLESRAPRESIEELLFALCGAEEPWITTLAARGLKILGDLDRDERGHGLSQTG